jgi:hypothetical protein
MTPDQTAEFDGQLKARDWRYDVGDEEFREGDRLLEWEELIGLVPGMTRDDLAARQDDQYDKSE